MTTELFWLALTATTIAFFWMPYGLNGMIINGPLAYMKKSSDQFSSTPQWVIRAKSAHSIAVENLIIFSILIIIAYLSNISNNITIGASILYYFGMVFHYIFLTLGIPYLRSAAFLVAGFGAEIALALTLFNII